MCGIGGIYDDRVPPDGSVLKRMASAMACRGPDGEGFFCRPPLGLAHRRLAVIDVRGGRQPLLNEDETLALVCNGEIYGFNAVRDKLREKGHRFRTGTDSEVLLHLYEDEGKGFVEALNGMFAFALADLRTGEIFFARDRFGQKPFFYAVSDRRFAFASGPAALESVPWVDSEPDLEAVDQYLEYMYVPAPRSILSGVRKLPPGSCGHWDGRSLKITSYWQPQMHADYRGALPGAAVELRRLVEKAVERRLVADVPLGCFLSGGMDSSIIAALAAIHKPGIKTFSIGFSEKEYDERRFARCVAKHIGSDHHFLTVTPPGFDSLAGLVRRFEEPFADASMLPAASLAAFAANQVTVALSGDGADELFGGYERYTAMRLLSPASRVPARLRRPAARTLSRLLPASPEERTATARTRRFLEAGARDGIQRYACLLNRFTGLSRRMKIYSPLMREACAGLNPLSFFENNGGLNSHLSEDAAASLLDMRTYLPDDILVKLDRATMAYGLEARCPFLDPLVAGFALSLPFRFKKSGFQRKLILREAFGDLLPAGILKRRKMGFGVPVGRWLRGPWLEPARDVLLSGTAENAGLFQKDRLEEMLDRHARRLADHSYEIFALLVLALWLENRFRPAGMGEYL